MEGKYSLALEFSSKKKEMTSQMWEDRQEKFQTFFGPGVTATITDTEQVRAGCLPAQALPFMMQASARGL